MGDQALCAKCKTFAQTFQTIPKVFIFDCDNKPLLSDVTAPPNSFKAWGNNVFSFAIPVPTHRPGYENVCIEMYYSDSEIRTLDQQGRRLFLTSEFSDTGTHREDPEIRVGNRHLLKGVTAEKSAKILDSDVYRIDKPIALSKSKFADYVLNDVDPFNKFNFEQFRTIFEIIDTIVATTRPTVNVFVPDLELFFQGLQSRASPTRQFITVLESVNHLFSMTLQLFIVFTLRLYERVILEEPQDYRKKVGPIKKLISEKYTNPSLVTIHALARHCYHLIDENAPETLRNFKACLASTFTLGPVGHFLDDLETLTPPEVTDVKTPSKVKLLNKAQSSKGLFEYVIPEIASYANKLDSLENQLSRLDESLVTPVAERSMEALRSLVTVVAPIFSQPFVLESIEELDAATRNYIVTINTYVEGALTVSQRTIPSDEVDEYKESAALMVIDRASYKTISLSPFFVISDDRLYCYTRTRVRGYEYQSALDGRVYVLDTKRKFNNSVFKTASKGVPQSLFWTEVTPDINPKNNVRANIPPETYDEFFGRERQIRQIREEILKIPNQNGIVFGLGGIGKTALMIELSLRLFDEESTNDILFDNIIWMSAKPNYYNPIFDSVDPGKKQFESLDTIISSALAFFEVEALDEYSFEEKKEFLLELLKDNRALLILDNFETIPKLESEAIIRFVEVEAKHSLRRHPGNFKVIITSRAQIPSGFHQIELSGLDIKASKKLMDNLYHPYRHSSKQDLTDEQKERLREATSGIPILIKHCYGQMFEFNGLFDAVVRDIGSEANKAVDFSFGEILKQLKGDACQLEILLLLDSHSGNPLLARQIADILERPESEIEARIPLLLNLQCVKRVNQGQTDKYAINDEIRLLTSRLGHEHQELDRAIRRKLLKNFTIEKQLEYSTEEQRDIEIFNHLLVKNQYLEAEKFLENALVTKPHSLLLRISYAEFLRDKKRNLDKAIKILEEMREDAHNHPAVLRLLISCYMSLAVPNFNQANVYVEQIEKLPLEDDKLRLEIADFYVRWSTSLKMRRELDPIQEKLRQQRYKELAGKALVVLNQIKEKTHEAYYLLAHCYHNKWNYESAFRMIETAIRLCKKDPLCYASYVSLRKTIITQLDRRRQA